MYQIPWGLFLIRFKYLFLHLSRYPARRNARSDEIRRPPLAVMSVFEIFEPSLAWPKSARIGFYGLRQHRRPSPPRCRFDGSFLLISFEISPRGARGTFFRLWRPPRALSESSWRGSRAQEASKALPEASGVDFWSHFGPQNSVFLGLYSSFRGMVFLACIWTIFGS